MVNYVKKADTPAQAIEADSVQNILDGELTVIKADTPADSRAAISSSSLDEAGEIWQSLYYHPVSAKKNMILPPPYDPARLERFIQTNNTLNQCISAYEVNIDGTGYEIEPKDPEAADGVMEQTKLVKQFWEEVFPCVSWTTVKRAIRRHQESVGNGYLEIMRTLEGDIAFLQHADAVNMRMLRLDEPVPVIVKMTREGQDIEHTVMRRERRFAQLIGSKIIYFREFGTSRHINKKTGEWETEDKQIEPQDRGNELIHFYPIKDADSPYGIPRWINNLPSVLGSRQAEEFNLDFFDCGGLPPALILIAGGELAQETKKDLIRHLSGKNGHKHRAAIVEAYSNTGGIDSAGSVSLTVERFGSERQDDSMFENYDEKCSKRIRAAFRLPPILVGVSQDYSLATAFASYVVAEAQVFKPERDEFDQQINTKIMREVWPEFVMRSSGVHVKDVTQQLRGVELLKGSMDHKELVATVNEVTSLNVNVADEKKDELVALPPPVLPNQPGNAPQKPAKGPKGAKSTPGGTNPQLNGKNPSQGKPVAAKKSVTETVEPADFIVMAQNWAEQVTATQPDATTLREISEQVQGMTEDEQILFGGYVSANLMASNQHDTAGIAELMAGAADILGHSH